MNARDSLSTIRALVAAAALCLVPAFTAGAQGEPDLNRFNRAMGLNPWNDGRNVNGVRTDSLTISFAEASAGFTSGGFRSFSDASTLMTAGAHAGTKVHGEKVSMTGAFTFDETIGKDMSGSMFIHPGMYPFDIYEFTPGQKTLDEYSFNGGLAARLSGHWTIGGSMDFASSNYSKRKDIRHTNYRLDMTVAPSVMFSSGDLRAGLSGLLRKESESVYAEQIGTATADSYFAFLDKGLMYGTYEVWNGSGIHLSETGVDRFPVKRLSWGGAAQFQWKWLYADAEVMRGDGEVGEKGYLWYRFPSLSVKARVICKMEGDGHTDIIRLGFGNEDLSNNEYVLDRVSEGGVITPQLYLWNRILRTRNNSLRAEYSRFTPRADFHARLAGGHNQTVSSLVYPYKSIESLRSAEASASATLHLGAFDLGLGAGYFQGRYSLDDAGEVRAAALPEEGAFRMDELYPVWREYQTASRWSGGLSVRYSITRGKVGGMYFQAGCTLTFAPELQFVPGRTRQGGSLRIGYDF